MTQVGFEIEGIYFVVATVILLFSLHGTNLNGPAKIVVIIIAALVQMILPLLGHATISKVLRYLAYLFIVFFAVLAGFTFNRLHLSTFHAKPVSFAVWTTALVLIISVGGLGWTENGNDYSRYLPRDHARGTRRSGRRRWAARSRRSSWSSSACSPTRSPPRRSASRSSACRSRSRAGS